MSKIISLNIKGKKMPDAENIQNAGIQALITTNDLLIQANKEFRVAPLTNDDMDWCIASSRALPEEHRLPWDQNGGAINAPDAFNFSFKLLDMGSRPAGACLCTYCPGVELRENEEPSETGPTLNVEMLQNFHIRDSELDGNTLKFALYAILFFIIETRCTGIRLIEPINDRIADYYIAQGFEDLTEGSKEILWRSSEDLLHWFQEGFAASESNSTIDSEQILGDNESSMNELDGGENGY
ncbi:hypothetical protein EOQ02_18385 [Escherichia coli]|uniref:hypothetical protein n=1 Tax=Enterobacter hormaechei TaxID=158836 RepID=UPI0019F33850|nr:hypothetical protein [Escherichia coli]EGO8478571.1 hypothetical protein [Escherichia coli]EHT4290629.1 hypothetical protein [Escherichia coli]ELV1562825.1 hypothetical protein [Escherichia coli]HDH7506453.1 hypothetical protein [Escherichia coli]